MTTPEDALAERNLAALRKRYPDYADMLSAVPHSTGFSFEKTGDVVLCRDAAGKWLHGPTDPRADAMREAAGVVRSRAELFVLVRPGLGYQAFALDEAIEQSSPGSVLLVIEDRLDLFRSSFSVADWSRIFHSPFAVLLLGNLEVAFEAFLDRHPKLPLLPLTLVAPTESVDPVACERIANVFSALADKSKAAAEAELASLDVHLTSRRRNRDAPRVLIAVEELGYLAEAIAEGFRSCGCEVELQPADKQAPPELRSQERFWKMAPVAPDLILWANRPELSSFASEACRELQVANVLWTMDSPPRLSLGHKELSGMDLHVCFDPTYLPQCAPFGARCAAQLSLGTGLRPLPGLGPSDSNWCARDGSDVGFVGSLGDARVDRLRTSLWSEQPEYAAFLDALAKQPEDAAAAFEEKTGRPYVGMPCFYVDEVRSAIRRIAVLSRMPRASMKIYGATDWIGAGSSFSECYGGVVRYGTDLARVYYNTRVNINVFHAQCRDATNSRVYDVLAAGGFLLTEDRPVLHREFEVGRHLITFSTPEEASDKVAYYLAHGAERDAIAREGQRHVLTHHTFPKRCRRLLELARPFMGAC